MTGSAKGIMNTKKSQIFSKGLVRENPVLVLLLGTCPTLAITTMAVNGLGMGAATTFVLFFSNFIIAAIKNIVPDKVRIPCYIIVIASLVTILQLLLQAYVPTLYDALGIYLPLITVNCIILGRAEAFAAKNSAVDSALDGLGMGVGFTLALFVIGSIRELLGAGTWMGITLTANLFDPMVIFLLPPGGFFIFGIVVALTKRLTYSYNQRHAQKISMRESFDCEACPSAAACEGRDSE